MKKVSILVPESSVMQAIADPQYLFSAANQFMVSSGKPPLFEIELVGAKRAVRLNEGLYTVYPQKLIGERGKTDLVLIPALWGDMETAIQKNKVLIPWIQQQYRQGAEVASLCVGAFLLAATGLVNGKKCSTHWGYFAQFRKLFPEVELVEGNIVTEEKRVYSSGGAHSYWNLLLHLLEKYASREMAILASRYFAVDIDRDSQLSYALFQGQKDHGDAEVRKAQEYIEKNIHDRISIDQLARLAPMGRRTFERRFKEATHNSVLEYIQRVKMEAAKRSFESSRKHINEVMYDVGYSDTRAFRTIFKKITGLTPVEYRNKYNRLVGRRE